MTTLRHIERQEPPCLDKRELGLALDWFKDCSWADYEPEDFDELSLVQINRGIARHYGGGIAQFKLDVAE